MSMQPPCPSEGADGPKRRVRLDDFRREIVAIQSVERAKKTAKRTEAELLKIERLGVVYLDQISRLVLSRWREAQPNVRDLTLKGYFSALRAALRYALACGYIERDPTLAMPMRFSSRKLDKKRCLDPAETMALFRLLRSEAESSWEGHRLYALAVTIFGVGLRAGEGQRLKVCEIDLPRGLIDLSRAKAKTEASKTKVAMPDFVADALARWLPECGSEWAFPHAYRTGPWVSGGVGKRPVDRLQAAARRAGISEGCTLAMGRHGWATFAETVWGLTEKEIQVQLRHTTPLTQRHYCHSGGESMRPKVALLRLPGFEAREGGERGEKASAGSA